MELGFLVLDFAAQFCMFSLFNFSSIFPGWGRSADPICLYVTTPMCKCGLFIFIVKLIYLLFSVCFATGYIHSREIEIFIML